MRIDGIDGIDTLRYCTYIPRSRRVLILSDPSTDCAPHSPLYSRTEPFKVKTFHQAFRSNEQQSLRV